MNKILSAIIFIFVVAIAIYAYWQHIQPEPAAAPVPAPAELQPRPEVRQMVEAPAAPVALPQLAESDRFMFDDLAALIGNPSLMKLFRTERIIHNIVATLDNLPRRHAPINVMPVKPAPGVFIIAGEGGDLTISPKNAVRYTEYVKIVDAIDAKQLVELYVHLYPLFQQAYEELGYPNRYFNDRLIEVIDDLLAAPDTGEPVRLSQPAVLYVYADPGLERRSIGQRILLRTGSSNEAKIKARLRDIKQELMLHLHEQKVESVN